MKRLSPKNRQETKKIENKPTSFMLYLKKRENNSQLIKKTNQTNHI